MKKRLTSAVGVMTSLISLIAVTPAAYGSEICEGDRIYHNVRGNGTVLEVYNGTAKIQTDGGGGWRGDSYSVPIRSLEKAVECYLEICKGNRVYIDGRGTASVIEVFSGGAVLIESDSDAKLNRNITETFRKNYTIKHLNETKMEKRLRCSDTNSCLNKLGDLNNLLNSSSNLDQHKATDTLDDAKKGDDLVTEQPPSIGSSTAAIAH